MSAVTELLPTAEIIAPGTIDELATVVADCHASGKAVYPIGGRTSLDYGVTPKAAGIALSLSELHHVIDYPARDMTITVEAGTTMHSLAETLAVERQELPIDVPQAKQATIGGVISTNWNGPRRYGLGTIRDYVIGISAVDGRGNPFKGGGRVVKNVAGYDFCKLLTGSLGILGVITQVTLKIRPLPEQSVLLAGVLRDADHAEQALAALNDSAATPVSVVLLQGSAWSRDPALASLSSSVDAYYLVVGLEGTADEVAWMQTQLATQWQAHGVSAAGVVDSAGSLGARSDAPSLWSRIVEWPASYESPLTIRANVRPSGVAPFMEAVQAVDPNVSILAHAGNGTVFAKFSAFPKEGLTRTLIGRLQPAAAAYAGHVAVLSSPGSLENTRQSVWGGNDGTLDLMRAVKRNFDPKDILNPGRFLV